MQFLITFLEGIITFISPCLLPLLPIYLSFFAGGGSAADTKKGRSLIRAAGFIVGFTIVFMSLGAAFGTLGRLLVRYQTWVNIIAGLIVIFFGITYLGIFRWNPFDRLKGINIKPSNGSSSGIGAFFRSMFFGIVFSISWTPCVGTFLGSALVMASTAGSSFKGILLLLTYSAGLGIPFFLCSLLMDRLTAAFTVIKSHYGIIKKVCGAFLILVGILMATGLLGKWLSLLS